MTKPSIPPQLPRLYVLVRGDLPPGYQIAQAIHAKDEFTHTYRDREKEWRETSNTIVVLNVPCKHSLLEYVEKASAAGVKNAVFREPDLDGEATAAAFEPSPQTSELFKGLPLALK